MKLLAWPGYGSQEVRNSVQVRCGGSALCFTQLTAHFTDFPLRVADSLWRSQRICDTRNEGRSRTLPSFPLFFPFSFFSFRYRTVQTERCVRGKDCKPAPRGPNLSTYAASKSIMRMKDDAA